MKQQSDMVEVGVVDFLRQTAAVLAELLDRMNALELRVAAIEGLVSSVRDLSTRVDEHSELFPLVEQMGRDVRKMAQRVEDQLARSAIRRPSKSPHLN